MNPGKVLWDGAWGLGLEAVDSDTWAFREQKRFAGSYKGIWEARKHHAQCIISMCGNHRHELPFPALIFLFGQ